MAWWWVAWRRLGLAPRLGLARRLGLGLGSRLGLACRRVGLGRPWLGLGLGLGLGPGLGLGLALKRADLLQETWWGVAGRAAVVRGPGSTHSGG